MEDCRNDLLFASDNRHLLTWHTDGTALVWDPYLLPHASSLLTPDEVRKCWDELAGKHAVVAFTAICRLIAVPKLAVPFFARALERDNAAEARVQRWLADLDSDTYQRREEAQRQLARLGADVVGDVREALKAAASLEAKLRLERLLRTLPASDPKSLQRIRALEVLERIGTHQAAAVLKKLAAGAPGSRLTREARESLERLTRMARDR
jgi:hypothetical protein